jgi:endonuclease I
MKVTKNSKGWAGKQVERVDTVDTTAHCFEPPDEVKGDLARAYFYMSIRYMHQFQCCQNNAVAGARIQAPLEAVLRRWHRQDPVDAREHERARRIAQDWQGNVNPFILFPELVDRIEDF